MTRRALLALSWLVLPGGAGMALRADEATFEVASVKPSDRQVGPDYNNQVAFSPAGFTGRNVTLRRLISEAYGLQLRQVIGPNWLDQNEYAVEARAGHAAAREQLDLMLRALLARRFDLKQHKETREMRIYALVMGKTGPKIHPLQEAESPKAGGGLRFHGEMRQFADFLAVQLSIPATDNPAQPATAGGPMLPVLDETGMPGTYDFNADLRPEPGTDSFTLWQRTLENRFGLRLESRRGPVDVIVVDSAAKIPTVN